MALIWKWIRCKCYCWLYISSWENIELWLNDLLQSVTTRSLKLCVTCVWPAVHLCSVGASHTSLLLVLFEPHCDHKQWGGETTLPTELAGRPRVHIRDWWPLSSSKSSGQSWWECLLFTCKLDPDERITCAEKLLSVYHSVQLYNLSVWCPVFSKMTFQFSLWDKFRELSNLPSSTFNNLVQLVTHFLQKKCLSLSILKVSALTTLHLYSCKLN